MIDKSRRNFVRNTCVMASIASFGGIETAHAVQNGQMRYSLKYQDSGHGSGTCSNCNLFIPGAKPTARGECRAIPGDTEISPNGYCNSWIQKK